MNLFKLDNNFFKLAEYHIDSHCNKLILESAQMASTAKWENNSEAPYKPTHKNHPTNIWVRTSLSNYLWCCNYGLALCTEFSYRRQKIHKTEEVLQWLKDNPPNISDIGITPFALAMPDQYKSNDPVESYRQYYINEKQYNLRGAWMMKYTNREYPEWFPAWLVEKCEKNNVQAKLS